MITQNNVLQVLVGKDLGPVAQSVADGSKIRAYGDILDGEMAVLDENNKVLNDTTVLTVPKIRVVARKGNSLIYSDWIEKGKWVSYRGQLDTAATEQITYVGYNGTDGAIEAINLNDYILKVIDTSAFQLHGNKRNMISAFYQSDAACLQTEVAVDMLKSLIPMLNSTEDRILVERVNSGTSTATSGGTIAFTKGSKTVTILGTGADAGKYDTDGATIVAGDFLRVGHATTKTYPVYRVAEVVSGGGATTMVVSLDVPYQGATSATTAAASVGVIPSATALAGDFGIKFTGIARSNFNPGVFKYDKVRFRIGLEDFGTTAVTYSQAATEGTGNYEQIAEAEWFCLGNAGQVHRIGTPSPTTTLAATSGKMYDTITIGFYDSAPVTITGQDPKSPKHLMLAFETGYSATEPPDLVATALDAIASAQIGAAASGLNI